jgi:hypothetical protein
MCRLIDVSEEMGMYKRNSFTENMSAIENTERFRVLLLREHDTIRESPRMEKQISKTSYFRGVPKSAAGIIDGIFRPGTLLDCVWRATIQHSQP